MKRVEAQHLLGAVEHRGEGDIIAGLLLGWIYEDTGSLWPPIIAHFGVNCWSILTLRRAYKGFKTHVAGAKKKAADGGDQPDA